VPPADRQHLPQLAGRIGDIDRAGCQDDLRDAAANFVVEGLAIQQCDTTGLRMQRADVGQPRQCFRQIRPPHFNERYGAR
jgi:hypothetical protein